MSDELTVPACARWKMVEMDQQPWSARRDQISPSFSIAPVTLTLAPLCMLCITPAMNQTSTATSTDPPISSAHIGRAERADTVNLDSEGCKPAGSGQIIHSALLGLQTPRTAGQYRIRWVQDRL